VARVARVVVVEAARQHGVQLAVHLIDAAVKLGLVFPRGRQLACLVEAMQVHFFFAHRFAFP
jgi:hypothetical protein